jgi:ribosomal protein S18 acetylase RimI-like enzyme
MPSCDPAPGPSGVRRARAADIESMVSLLAELFSIEADFSFNPDKQRRGLADLLERGDEACLLVCEREGEVVGMCSVQALVSTAEGGKVGLLEDMVVAAPWRGRGLGSALLAAAEQWSAGQGMTRLQLLADATNESALGFYRRQDWGGTRLITFRKLL